MKKVIVLSGAGISAESGLKTFRDSDGLWENYRVEDVATPHAWLADPKLVLNFYNERRKQVRLSVPNAAHLALVRLEQKYDVRIVTQNIDDLHERAGSSKVLHLHGEILKSRSTIDPRLVYPIEGDELNLGDYCERGSQLRPHIVWFGEMVPQLENAAMLVSQADILMVIGTSLNVYPAAGLINYAPSEAEKYLIDPGSFTLPDFTFVQKKAGTGVPEIVDLLLKKS
ncbi:MAG: NAD-dependent deacylase [Bacteroidetes bacterium]|nr:NAD-dependent deacylase [Bacteroidota bacterium]